MSNISRTAFSRLAKMFARRGWQFCQTSRLALSHNTYPGKADVSTEYRLTALILDHADQFRIVEHSEERLPPRLRAAAADYRRSVFNNFSAVIERGIQAGEFRPTDARGWRNRGPGPTCS